MKFPPIPKELLPAFQAVSALKDDEHWAIFISFIINEETRSLTHIREEFDSTYHDIKPIVDDLIEGDLIEQFILKNEDYPNLDKRYYRISLTGLRFYYNLMDALLPPKQDT